MLHSKVRLIPNLSTTAPKRRFDEELTLQRYFKGINYWGSNYPDLQMVLDVLVQQFYYSKRAAYRILSSGNGIFWKSDPFPALTDFKSKSTA